ncbi:hypothetical protein ACFUJR_14765 [Streptomyces sp. NPDC057271]|uniref:hypothetical protein n=1 Tax=unclassified Streptomyces TaxID=2593676 RepID=UPI00363D778A
MPEETATPESSQPNADTGQEPETPSSQTQPEALETLLATLDDEVKLALLNEGGKKALLAEREAAKAARRERDAALAKVQEHERAKLTEQERLTADLTEAQQHVQTFRQRAVQSEVRALASAGFADPEDAHAFLDLDSFVNSEGDIDSDAIRGSLADLLQRKPHLAKPVGNSPRRPAPDRTQGSSGNGNRTPNSPAEEFAGFMQRALKGR